MKIIISIISVVILTCLSAYQKGFFNDFPLFGIVGFIYISALALLLFRRVIICMLKSEAVYKPKKVIEKNRPFFINKTKWDDICSIALEQKKDQERFCSYIGKIRRYISSGKPDRENDEEWRSLIHKAFG